MSSTPAPGTAPRPPDIGRRTLTPVGYAVCVAVPVLVAAVGLGLLHLAYDEDDLVSGQQIAILTSDWEPGDPGDDALAAGELVLGDDRCLRLRTEEGADVDLVWPAGHRATLQRDGPVDVVRVYDADRVVVARSGDTVRLGGGSRDVGGYAGRPCAPDTGEVFVVQSGVTVVPQA